MDTVTVKQYVAMSGDMRIITVYATDYDDAKNQVINQLSRPGRYMYLQAWIKTGKVIILERSH